MSKLCYSEKRFCHYTVYSSRAYSSSWGLCPPQRGPSLHPQLGHCPQTPSPSTIFWTGQWSQASGKRKRIGPASVRPSVLWDIYSKQVMRRQRRRCEQTHLFTTSSTTRSDGGVFSTVITNSRGADRQQQAIKRRTECASSTTLLNVHHLTGSLLSPEISYNRPTNSSAPTYLLTLPSPAPPRLRDSNLVYSEFALFHVTFGYVLYPYTVKTAEVDSTGT